MPVHCGQEGRFWCARVSVCLIQKFFGITQVLFPNLSIHNHSTPLGLLRMFQFADFKASTAQSASFPTDCFTHLNIIHFKGFCIGKILTPCPIPTWDKKISLKDTVLGLAQDLSNVRLGSWVFITTKELLNVVCTSWIWKTETLGPVQWYVRLILCLQTWHGYWLAVPAAPLPIKCPVYSLGK